MQISLSFPLAQASVFRPWGILYYIQAGKGGCSTSSTPVGASSLSGVFHYIATAWRQVREKGVSCPWAQAWVTQAVMGQVCTITKPKMGTALVLQAGIVGVVVGVEEEGGCRVNWLTSA